MKITDRCPSCGSYQLDYAAGEIAPFITTYVFRRPLVITEDGIYPELCRKCTCRDCGLVFSDVRFDAEEMKRLYDGYRGERYVFEREKVEPGYSELNVRIGNGREIIARAENTMQFLRHLGSFQRCLDYGGDNGQHIPDGLAYEKVVYEVSRPDSPQIRDLGKFDIILLNHVLEHLPTFNEVFADIRACCINDTYLYVEVPVEVADIFHEHVNQFDLRSLSVLLRVQGFDVIKSQLKTVDFGWCQPRILSVLARPGWL